MCQHDPKCPPVYTEKGQLNPERDGARIVADHLGEQGWARLCTGLIIFEDQGELTPAAA